MVYGYRCGVSDKPNLLMTFIEMRFFSLALLIMSYRRGPFTYIYEWIRCSPSYESSHSLFLTLVVATVALVFESIICFSFQPPMTSLCDIHLYCELGSYGNHNTSCVFLHIPIVILSLQLKWVVLSHSTLALSFGMLFGSALSLLWVHISKVPLLLFKYLLSVDSI